MRPRRRHSSQSLYGASHTRRDAHVGRFAAFVHHGQRNSCLLLWVRNLDSQRPATARPPILGVSRTASRLAAGSVSAIFRASVTTDRGADGDSRSNAIVRNVTSARTQHVTEAVHDGSRDQLSCTTECAAIGRSARTADHRCGGYRGLNCRRRGRTSGRCFGRSACWDGVLSSRLSAGHA